MVFTLGYWPIARCALRLVAIILFVKAGFKTKLFMILATSTSFILAFYFELTLLQVTIMFII
jgi:hypothetical protein